MLRVVLIIYKYFAFSYYATNSHCKEHAMKILKPYMALVLCAFVVLTSCFKEPDMDLNSVREDWNFNLLAPLIRTDMFIEDAANLSNVSGNVVIEAATISPLWSGPAIVPPASGLSTESKPSEFAITEYFEKIYTDTLNMTVTLNNNLPITIGKGTVLVYRNKDEQSIIAKKALDKDVAPGEEYEFEFLIYHDGVGEPPLVESDIQFYLEDFRTEGTEGQIVDFDGKSVTFNFKMNWVRIAEILVNADQQFKDTLNLAFESNDSFNTDGVLQDAIAGKITLYLKSGMPLNVDWDMDLLDENNNFIMNLTNNDIDLDAALVDNATGDVTEFRETALVIDLDEEYLDGLQKTRTIRAAYDINSIGVGENGVVRITRNSFISIQVVVDLVTKPAKLELEN